MSASTKFARRLIGAGALGGVLVASLSTAAFACDRTGSSGSQHRSTASRSTSDDGSQYTSYRKHTVRSQSGSTADSDDSQTLRSTRTTRSTASTGTQNASSSNSSTAASTTTTRSSGTSSSGTCTASMYDEPQLTATGEQFNPQALTAASTTLPLNSTATVTNPQTGKSVTVRINDRGPYVGGRCIDLSAAAFAAIGNPSAGLMQVNISS